MKARWFALLGVAIGSATLFVACANGTVSNAPDDGGGTTDDGGNGDATTGGRDGSSVGSDDGGETDAGEDAGPSCIDDDAGCSTGNPGLCNDGNHHCLADGGSVCVPLYTTQPCYTGPASTRDKGICHDGTQSCVGSVGECEGQGLPNGVNDAGVGTPVENCFNTPAADDDCDGLIDQGCPVSLSLTNQRTLTGAGGGGGGGPFNAMCPAGAFITRVDSIFYDTREHATGVSIYCATPTLTQGASSYTIALAANTPAPYATQEGSDTSSDVRTDDCGIAGITGIHTTCGLEDSYVEGLGNHCATSTLNFDPTTNQITFNFVNDGNTSYNDWPDST
ncbi:MAG: hypothetical protein ACREJX_14405, partial [Polyangiaceae bacterium]